jgi:male germ cell-associated kinase
LTIEEIMNFFSMILISLHYLHAKGIIQRDLHPRNILVNAISPGEFKILQITDFGLSKNLKIQENYSQTLADRTALSYKAPEVFRDEKSSTTKVDMWALGIILFELTTKKHPIS